MDKITHQIRAEHWARILNECMNSGMSKTAWCRANGISEKQFFYWQRILRREAYEPLRIRPCLQLQRQDSYLAVKQSVSFAEIKFPAVSPDASSVFHPDLELPEILWRLAAHLFHFYILSAFGTPFPALHWTLSGQYNPTSENFFSKYFFDNLPSIQIALPQKQIFQSSIFVHLILHLFCSFSSEHSKHCL